MARFWIPFYNLWGFWNIHRTYVDRLKAQEDETSNSGYYLQSLIPAEVRTTLLLSVEELEEELLRMTDAYTDELFEADEESCRRLVYPVSRLVVDPERFLEDDQEPMADRGMGAVYLMTSDGRPLRKPLSRAERDDLIDRYYHPHHAVFNRLVRECLEERGSCLIIDCHSFPSTPLPYETDQSSDRPDICIGTDEFHTPMALQSKLVNLFERSGYTVAVNRPFAGSIVPGSFYHRNRQVQSVMIEVNRKLYMEEGTGRKSSGFDGVRSNLYRIIKALTKDE